MPLISLICSPNSPLSSSHSFSIPGSFKFMIILAFLAPHSYNGSLSSDLLGFGWHNTFSDVISFIKVSQEINERGTFIFCYAKHSGNTSKLHLKMKNTAGN